MSRISTASRIAALGFVVGACVGCDQATKLLANRHLAGREPVSLIGGIVRLSYVENPGAFLGLGAHLSGTARFWVLGVAVAVSLALLVGYALAGRISTRVELCAIALVIGGGVGNLIDRASLGIVRDFLNVGVGNVRTGIFNVADLAVTGGALAFVALSWAGRVRGNPSGKPRRALSPGGDAEGSISVQVDSGEAVPDEDP